MPNRHRSPVLLFDLDAITWSITAIAEVATHWQRHKHGRSLPVLPGQLRPCAHCSNAGIFEEI